MTATAAEAPLPRAWRTARITPLAEVLAPGRIAATAVRLGLQVFLVTCLWRALYANTHSSAGLVKEQAVSYAVLAALAVRIRGLDRAAGRDMMIQHIQYGTIVYWFLRPVRRSATTSTARSATRRTDSPGPAPRTCSAASPAYWSRPPRPVRGPPSR